VLPPFVAYRVDRFDEAGFEPIAERLRERMRSLATTAPIPYRRQNGGDYLIPNMELRPGLEGPNAAGFALHRKASNPASYHAPIASDGGNTGSTHST
jgi:NAD(P)H dehydrogenase (quinone)